jgi:methionyl-tRNA formyltransferase
MRVVVFGYSEIGYVCLEEIIRQGDEIVAVVTHEDRPGELIWWRSMAKLAAEHDIPVFTPADCNTPEFVAKVRGWAPDIIFSFYYRNMICEEILAIPPLGALNMHGSYLPKYRGRAPVNWAILDGATETGLTLHYMVRKPDAGDIVDQRKVTIEPEDTAQTVFNKLVPIATQIMRETLPRLREGSAPRIPQDHSQATYFGARRPADGAIDWSWPAKRINDLVRAVTHPYPGAFVDLNGKKVFVWKAQPLDADSGEGPGTVIAAGEVIEVAAGSGTTLRILQLQAEGKDDLDDRAFAARYAVAPGARFGNGRRG